MITFKLILDLICGLIALFLVALVVLAIVLRKMSQRRPDIARNESEKCYLDRSQGSKKRFPVVDSNSIKSFCKSATVSQVASSYPVYLSVIVPAYNEEKRLPVMLDEAISYLEKRTQLMSMDPLIVSGRNFNYEIIIVDDGSTDRTTQVALDYSDKYGTDKIRVLTLSRNRGKGGAVRLGVLSSRGFLVLFADADGATKFSEIEKLERALLEQNSTTTVCERQASISVGSRAHLEEEAIATRSAIRTFLMHGFHFLVWFSAVRSVRDTQCGFKLLPRKVADLLFSWIHVEKWAFDVELLYLCEALGIQINEVCVSWTEIEGSKVVPVFSWLQMGRDVLSIAFMYTIGAWSIPEKETESK